MGASGADSGPVLRAPALRPLDYVFFMRPTVIVGMWVFFLWGAALGAGHAGLTFPSLYPSRPVLLGFLAMTAVLGGGCVLNQITDIETDRVNGKLFFLPRGIISLRAAWTELALLWVAALVLSAFLPVGFRVVLAASLFINLTYSAPMVAAKSRFPWDVVWNGLGFGVASSAAGWASVAPLSPALLAPALAYALVVAGATASTSIPDVDGDRSAGLRTTAAVLGKRGASVLTLVLVSAAALVGALTRDPLALFGPLLALPLLVKAHRSGERSDRTLANEAMVLAFGLVATVRMPYLLVLLLLVYFASRGYYRARFGLSYPGPGAQ